MGSDDAVLAERIAWRVVISHSSFLDAARRRDALLAQKTWSDYLFTTSRTLVSRNISRQPIDMAPLSPPGPDEKCRHGVDATQGAGRGKRNPFPYRRRSAPRRRPTSSLAELADEFDISRPTLREALRILEMEFLLDLRTGDRGGATIRTPSTRVAAQLAGIVLEARKTTFADFLQAVQQMVPAIMGLVASRIAPKQLKALDKVNSELADSIKDTTRFVPTWEKGEMIAFSAVKNPALTVIAEILHWVRVGVDPAVAADAKGLPWVSKTNRNAQRLFRNSYRPPPTTTPSELPRLGPNASRSTHRGSRNQGSARGWCSISWVELGALVITRRGR